MLRSTELDKIIPALAKATASVQKLTKDAANPYFKSSYATLAHVLDTVKGPLAEQEIIVVQPTKRATAGETVIVQTFLIHASGQFIGGELECKLPKTDAQTLGSMVTYLRRYGLQSLIGLSAVDEDDDGNAASAKHYPTVQELLAAVKTSKASELPQLEQDVRELVSVKKLYEPATVSHVVNICLQRMIVAQQGKALAATMERIPAYVERGYLSLQQSQQLSQIFKAKQSKEQAT
jgi:hypothetical protein